MQTINDHIEEAKEKLVELKGALFSIKMDISQQSNTRHLSDNVDKIMGKINHALQRVQQTESVKKAVVLAKLHYGNDEFEFSKVFDDEGMVYGYLNRRPCIWWGKLDESECPSPFSGCLERDSEKIQAMIADRQDLDLIQRNGDYVWVVLSKREVLP